MDYKALLIKYKYSYGESYKEKMINFLTEVMGEYNNDAQDYWMSLHNYDKIGKFLEESKVETFEEQVKFLEDNKYKFDGYVKSCEDSNKEYHDNIVNNLKKAGLHNIEA